MDGDRDDTFSMSPASRGHQINPHGSAPAFLLPFDSIAALVRAPLHAELVSDLTSQDAADHLRFSFHIWEVF